jgi:hypothetical protein
MQPPQALLVKVWIWIRTSHNGIACSYHAYNEALQRVKTGSSYEQIKLAKHVLSPVPSNITGRAMHGHPRAAIIYLQLDIDGRLSILHLYRSTRGTMQSSPIELRTVGCVYGMCTYLYIAIYKEGSHENRTTVVASGPAINRNTCMQVHVV